VSLRIDLIAGARGGNAAAQMFFLGVYLGWNGIAGAAHSGAVGIAALHDEIGDHPMKGEPVVETLLGQGLEVIHGLGGDRRIELDYDGSAFGVDSRVVAGVSHW